MKAAASTLLLFTLMLLSPNFAHSLYIGDSFQLHGFASQGYLHSSDNNFLAHSRSGSIKFSEIALNRNWKPLNDLRFGAQLYYRNLGNYTENKVVLDWGLVEFQPIDELGLHLGKIKLPLGYTIKCRIQICRYR